MDNNIDQMFEELQKLIKNKSVKLSREFLDEYPIAYVASCFEQLSLEDQLFYLRVLKRDEAAELFSYLDDEVKAKLAISFTEEWGMEILQELQSDELADVIEDLPANIQKRILFETPPEKRNLINSILKYKEDQVGSIMSVDISTIRADYTCKKALSKIKRDYKKNNAELSHYFFVTDDKGVLLGSISLEDIVFANENEKIESLYSAVPSVYAHNDTEHASNIFAEHDMSSLPVVTSDNRLVGMITSDDVIDIVRNSATEDMYKMAGITIEDNEESYIKTTVLSIVKSRILWLIILMISATLSQFIIQSFTDISENFIKSLGVTLSTAIIVSLIPVISGAAGNAGSQSSTTITRSLALGEIESKDIKKVILKEFNISVIVGFILFFVNVLRLSIYFLISGDLLHADERTSIIFMILASSIALWFVIVLAKFLGTIIPIFALKLKKDPAVMSAPILTTLTDAISTLIFFGITIFIFWISFVVLV